MDYFGKITVVRFTLLCDFLPLGFVHEAENERDACARPVKLLHEEIQINE